MTAVAVVLEGGNRNWYGYLWCAFLVYLARVVLRYIPGKGAAGVPGTSWEWLLFLLFRLKFCFILAFDARVEFCKSGEGLKLSLISLIKHFLPL